MIELYDLFLNVFPMKNKNVQNVLLFLAGILVGLGIARWNATAYAPADLASGDPVCPDGYAYVGNECVSNTSQPEASTLYSSP